MANLELDGLSPEQIRQLAGVLSEAKSLPAQQEEIIKKVLDGEIDIGKTRIAQLEKFFNSYLEKLDLVARKYSTLSDTFLILNQELSGDVKEAFSEISKLAQQRAQLRFGTPGSKDTGGDGSSDTGGGSHPSDPTEVFDTQSHKNREKLEKVHLTTIEDLRKTHLSKIEELHQKYEDSLLELTLVRSKKREDLVLRSKEFQLKELIAVTNAELEAQKLSTELDTQLDYASTNSGAKDLGALRVRLLQATEEEKSLQELKKQLDAKRILLEYEARAQHNGKLLKKDAVAIEKQISDEFKKRKSQLDKLTAERFAKERLLAETGINDEFEKKKLERRRALELATLRRNNGIITKEELLTIEEIVNKEFTLRSSKGKQLLAELGKARLVEAELEARTQNDPAVAVEREARIKKEIADLEYQYRLAHNNELTLQARKDIELLVKTKYATESAINETLAQEYFNKLKLARLNDEDPALAAERDAKIKKEIAELEYQYRLTHNNQLDELAREQIRKQAEERYLRDSVALEKLAQEYTNKLILTQLNDADPALAAERDAKIKKEIADLEYEYRLTHNNQLDELAREQIRKQAEERYLLDKTAIEKLAKEYTDKLSVSRLKEADPEVGALYEKKRAEMRRHLELEAMRRNNGIISQEERERIEARIDYEFQRELDKNTALLDALGAQRLRDAELAALKEYDPGLAQALEKEKADLRSKLELESRQRHGGKLLESEVKRIKALAEEEYNARSVKAEEIAKKYADQLTVAEFKENDSGAGAIYDEERAERKRILELEALRRNNGIISKEEREQIDKQLEYEFQQEFANNTELLDYIAKKRLEAAEMANLDSGLVQAIEKEKAEYRSKLELEARLANNGILTKAEADSIKRLADEEYKARGSKAEEVAKRNANQLKRDQNQLKLDQLKETNPAAGAALEAAKIKFIAAEEYKLRKQYNRLLTADEIEHIKQTAELEFELSEQNEERLRKIQEHADKKAKRDEISKTDQTIAHAVQLGGFSKEDNFLSRMDSLFEIVENVDEEDQNKAALLVAVKALSSLVAQLESKIDAIGSYKGGIDTRLQGSNNKKVLGSYWDQLTRDMMSVGAVTPFFKQEDFANNIKTLVDTGIAFDLKQRAFLMTIQEKIANTFNVADGTLLRLIRIQQEDSTAGRLGMESALNTFLNNMYENTEYLKGVAESVRGSLQEMEALMAGAEATEVEYQVQKWMGSLYSVGMSQEAVNSIATALGQIAAGQVDALTSGNGAGNLMVMAANDAGLTISDILTKGLDASETNRLLQATVNYLAELAEASKDNQVIQQQLASVFGVKASDLRAATNLATNNTTADIFKSQLSYDNMIKQLNNMAGSMILRTSIGEMMTNIWENGQYTLASSMANNPVSYILYKMASLLEDTTGGISLPFLNVMGFGVDLETTVADLMRVASVSTGILGSLGAMVSGLGASFSGRAMLTKMGIESGSGLTVTPRGGGGTALTALEGGGAQTTSSSGYVGNASGSDVKNSTIQESEDSKKQQMIEAKEEAETNQVDILNAYVLQIYEILNDVTSGKRNFNVKVAGYGLTSLGNGTSISGAQGGVAGLLNSTTSGANGSGSLDGGFSTGGYLSGSGAAGGNSSGGGYTSGGTGSGGSYGSGAGGGFSSGSAGTISIGSSSGGGAGLGGSAGSGSSYGSLSGIDLGGWTIR